MLQPPAPAPSPAPPAPEPTPTPVIQSAPAITGALPAPPANAEQVRGLRARREILSEELSSANQSRDELLGRLRSADRDERPGLEQRLRVMDERILQLEQDVAISGRQLAATPSEVLAQTVEPDRPGGMVDDDDAMGMMVGGFTFGLLVALVGSRIARRWRRRRGVPDASAAAAAAALADPRIDRLGQAVDAMALEVERIGEGQRFVTQLLAEQKQPILK